jgi:hypothetical protein
MSSKRKKDWISQRDAEAALWSGFEDFVTHGDLFSFTDHAGIDLRGVRAEQVWDKFLAHYKRDGGIDWDHFLKDFDTWGPIASRIAELRLERKAKARTQARSSKSV